MPNTGRPEIGDFLVTEGPSSDPEVDDLGFNVVNFGFDFGARVGCADEVAERRGQGLGRATGVCVWLEARVCFELVVGKAGKSSGWWWKALLGGQLERSMFTTAALGRALGRV
jgi:hypothetical protein